MRDYELVVIINPSVADDEVPSTMEKVNSFITERGGTITETNPWGRRRLAYPIKGSMDGNYVLTQINMDPKMTVELEASLELSEDVLRHLLVRLGD